jgi:hypothetical protein
VVGDVDCVNGANKTNSMLSPTSITKLNWQRGQCRAAGHITLRKFFNIFISCMFSSIALLFLVFLNFAADLCGAHQIRFAHQPPPACR